MHKILVIDNEKKFCQMLKRRLEMDGDYAVTAAYSGQEGLEQARATTFDLVITDFSMPDMDGARVLAALKALQPRLPVLFCSVYHDDPAVIPPAALAQADGVIAKPLDRQQLYQAITQALRSSR